VVLHLLLRFDLTRLGQAWAHLELSQLQPPHTALLQCSQQEAGYELSIHPGRIPTPQSKLLKRL